MSKFWERKGVKKLKKVAVVFSAMALSMMLAAVAPAFAKNFNVPEGVNRVYYSGGEGVIAVPTGWPTGGAHPTLLHIKALDVEIGTLGSADNIEIDVPYPMPDGSTAWLPVAYFTTSTNPDTVSWAQMLLSGFPAALLLGNIRGVSDSVLKVERHGNSVTVELTASQTVLWFNPTHTGVVAAIIPAFTMQLDKVGGSVHKESVTSLTGYSGASGWTGYVDQMGFNADGVFTCTGWNSEMSDCFITMHGISTWVPP